MEIEEVAEWFWIAEEDIKSAKLLSINKNKSNEYYHISQAVEKYNNDENNKE
ncbi:hypothetical protein [Treponema sp. R80B11-R83G3]